MSIEVTDRYDILGPPNGCKGPCEGTGWVPVKGRNMTTEGIQSPLETDPVLLALWNKAEEENPTTDGYHFVPCPTCS